MCSNLGGVSGQFCQRPVVPPDTTAMDAGVQAVPRAPPGEHWTLYQDPENGALHWEYNGPYGIWFCWDATRTILRLVHREVTRPSYFAMKTLPLNIFCFALAFLKTCLFGPFHFHLKSEEQVMLVCE